MEPGGGRAARPKKRKLIWPDAERLDLEQSIERVQKTYPDFPRNEVEESYLTGLIWATIRKTTPRRNSTNLTASQSDGSPTISKRKKPQKNTRELVTLENKLNDLSNRVEYYGLGQGLPD